MYYKLKTMAKKEFSFISLAYGGTAQSWPILILYPGSYLQCLTICVHVHESPFVLVKKHL
jgi:hypothetical protein